MAGSDCGQATASALAPVTRMPPSEDERLRVAEHRLPLLRIGEQFRQPRDGGDEFDADADERHGPEEQQFTRGR